MQILSLIIFAN